MTKPGLLIVFSGPSGVGKGTVLRRFLRDREDCVISVSATTREPRPGEKDGVHYYFITKEQFGELSASGEMLEHAQYGGNLYGTPKQAVEALLEAGKHVILEIDVQGAMQIKDQEIPAVFVFVMPPDRDTLRQRLTDRATETEASLEKRLRLAEEEMRSAGQYDYILINDDVDRCAEDLAAVITAAGCAAVHMKGFIEEVSSHA